MKITIFASIWSQNLWDELILKNEIKLLEKQYWEETNFIVFTYDKKNPFYKARNVEYKQYFPIWIRDYKNIFKNIINFFIFIFVIIRTDLIIIWWGWLFYDNEYQSVKSPLDSWLFRINVFNFFSKKYDFFRIWVNIKNKENNKKIEKIFKKARNIEVRDSYSFWLLNELWIKSEIKKDPVFYDRKEIITKKSIIWKIDSKNFSASKISQIDFQELTVWIALRKWYLVEKSATSERMEEWKIRETINFILRNWWKVVLLPHSFHESDSKANDFKFLEKFVWSDQNITIKKSMVEVYSTYKNKEIDLCLSMRLHSIILSHVYEIPFIGLSYSKKTDEILDSL